jgi:hypothetical protein
MMRPRKAAQLTVSLEEQDYRTLNGRNPKLSESVLDSLVNRRQQ